jgi:protein TonB
VIRRLGGVSLSVLLHAGLIALLLAWSAVDRTRPLFVDLSERAPAQGSPETAPSPAPPTRRAARAAGSASVPSRAPARPEPVAAEIPSAPPVAPAPPPAERMVPVAPPAPTPAAEPVPAPAPVPVAPALPSGSSVASAPADTRGGADTGAGGPSGAPSRGDGDRGPGGGPGASGSGAPPAEYGPYLRRFRQRVQESLVYPLAARRQGLGGTVELHVWLEATGRVRDVRIARSSSHDVLDEAAVQTIRRLGLVPFPDSLPRRPLLIRIPLVYELR